MMDNNLGMISRHTIPHDVANGDLRLLFGPTNLAPLSKITGYEMWGDDRFDSTHYHTYSYWHR